MLHAVSFSTLARIWRENRTFFIDLKLIFFAVHVVFAFCFAPFLSHLLRYVPSATKEQFKDDLGLTDSETSLPLTSFIIVYMITSPIFSHLNDLGYTRKGLIFAGVIFWSLATAAAALAQGFWTLLLFRSLVGVGEAAYATLAPALLSDFYPAAQRNSILSIFYLAVPIGSALGYVIGGVLGGAYGWRAAFLACGVPGVVLAVFTLFINEPKRGRYDNEEGEEGEGGEEEGEQEDEGKGRGGEEHEVERSWRNQMVMVQQQQQQE